MTDALLGEEDLPAASARGDDAVGPEDHEKDEESSEVNELVLELVVLERAHLEVLG